MANLVTAMAVIVVAAAMMTAMPMIIVAARVLVICVAMMY